MPIRLNAQPSTAAEDVNAYLRDSVGTLITSTTVGSDEAIDVNVVQTVGGGGGTEYTEGDTDVTFTGPMCLAEGPSDTATTLKVDASSNLQVDIAADSAGLATAANQLADGHNVTANAGTNLNTSALALDTSVDGIEGLLSTIDADTSTLAAFDYATETTLASIDTTLDGLSNVISTDNSTTTLLGISGSYTGTFEDVSAYDSITVHIYSDVSSASNGVLLDFSSNMSFNEDLYVYTLDVGVSQNLRIAVPVTAQYFRIRYTNGAIAQASFSIQTILHKGHVRTIDTGTGDVGDFTQRVVLADDQPVIPINDNAGSITVDGTLTCDAGTNLNTSALALDTSVDGIEALLTTIDADTSSIAAGQLPDGHNVTVDNAAGASAVNIQDGGNSITVDGAVTATIQEPLSVDDNGSSLTVDGTVAATQSGTWNINNISGTVSLPTGAATSTNQTTLIGRFPAASAMADGASNATTMSRIGTRGMVYNGSTWDRARGNTVGAYVHGGTAHDAADAGNPLKIGGRATDYQPDTEDAQGASEVAANDRVNGAFNLRGEFIEGVNGMYHLFDGTFPNTGLDGVYDDGTAGASSSTSEAVECWNYRYATVGLEIDSTASPTTIQITFEVSPDNTSWFAIKNGALSNWVYDDTFTATAQQVALGFDIAASFCRVTIEATGLTSTDFFTVDDSYIQLRN